jgi:hypothetical protein
MNKGQSKSQWRPWAFVGIILVLVYTIRCIASCLLHQQLFTSPLIPPEVIPMMNAPYLSAAVLGCFSIILSALLLHRLQYRLVVTLSVAVLIVQDTTIWLWA